MIKHINKVIYVTFVEESSGWNGKCKNIYKKSINIILLPSQNPKVPRNVMGFMNRAQISTGSNYLDVDSPFLRTAWQSLEHGLHLGSTKSFWAAKISLKECDLRPTRGKGHTFLRVFLNPSLTHCTESHWSDMRDYPAFHIRLNGKYSW